MLAHRTETLRAGSHAVCVRGGVDPVRMMGVPVRQWGLICLAWQREKEERERGEKGRNSSVKLSQLNMTF